MVTEAMNRIRWREKQSIFDVGVKCSTTNTHFIAHCSLRGGPSYSADGETAAEALLNLEQVLDALICPHCGHVRE